MNNHYLPALLLTAITMFSCQDRSADGAGKVRPNPEQGVDAKTAPADASSIPKVAAGSPQALLPPGHPPQSPNGGHPSPAGPNGSAQPTQTLAITWNDPTAWKKVPSSSSMRHATYRINGSTAGQDAELAVFYFGVNQGGSIDQNMQRWSGQFSDVTPEDVVRNTRTQNGLSQHTIEIKEGSFSASMMAAASPNSASEPTGKSKFGLLGAIIEAPTGSYFFKLTGPSATVQSARADFFALLDSIKNRQ